MSRKNIIEIAKLIQAGLTQDDYGKSKKRFDYLIKELKEPITLADFLGWEEGVEYKVDDDVMKITQRGLEIYDDEEEWFELFDGCWTNVNIIELRNAKKIESKKILCED